MSKYFRLGVITRYPAGLSIVALFLLSIATNGIAHPTITSANNQNLNFIQPFDQSQSDNIVLEIITNQVEELIAVLLPDASQSQTNQQHHKRFNIFPLTSSGTTSSRLKMIERQIDTMEEEFSSLKSSTSMNDEHNVTISTLENDFETVKSLLKVLRLEFERTEYTNKTLTSLFDQLNIFRFNQETEENNETITSLSHDLNSKFQQETEENNRTVISLVDDLKLELEQETGENNKEIISLLHALKLQLKRETEKNNKKFEEIVQQLGAILIDGIAQSIRFRQFLVAEQRLQSSDDEFKKISVREVYDNRTDNFELLISFAESIRDHKLKLQVYEALYDEMIKNGHKNVQNFVKLGRFVKMELDQSDTTAAETKSLYDNLCKEVREATIEPFSSAFLKNDFSPIKQLQDDINLMSNNSDCLSSIYDQVIEKRIDQVGLEKLLELQFQGSTYAIENIVFQDALKKYLEGNSKMNTDSVDALARYMKSTASKASFADVDEYWKSRHENNMNMLPKPLLATSTSTTEKSTKTSNNSYLSYRHPWSRSSCPPPYWNWYGSPYYQWYGGLSLSPPYPSPWWCKFHYGRYA